MLKKVSAYWKALLIIVLSLIVIRLLFFLVHPQNNIQSEISSSVIRSRALQVAEYLNYKSSNYHVLPVIRTNTRLIEEYQKKYGIAEGNRAISRNEISRFWEVTWMKNNDMVFGSSDRQFEQLKDFIGRLSINYDLRGNLIGLVHGFPDTLRMKPITEEEGKEIVIDFSAKFLPYLNQNTIKFSEKGLQHRDLKQINFEEKSPMPPPQVRERIDYTFTASYYDSLSASEKKINISITGTKISSVKLLDYKLETVSIKRNDTIHQIINALLIIASIVLIIVLLFKRFRAFEVGFKQSLKVAILTAVFTGIELFISISGILDGTYIAALIFLPLVSGLGVLIVWTITESIGREKWKEKFIPLDLFLKGYLNNSKVGNSFINGISLGFGLNAVILILYFATEKVFRISIITGSSDYLSYPLGAGKLFFGSISSTIYLFLIYVVFSTTYLKGKMKKSHIITSGGIIYGLINTGFVSPDFADIVLQSLIGIIVIWFFIENDILGTYIGISSAYFIFRAEPMLFISTPLYAPSFIIIVSLFSLVIIWSLYTIITKDKALDFDSLAPAYAARITERERLKRELEIAEEVQISFLPKKDPILEEISISSRCVPASEVGGDYYDYIMFDDSSVGIVIGDVSGKGIQASFYMTLVKGFLKAIAKQTSSTSGILNKLNELFCENVERGNFITMLFAKINLKEKRLIFSRAGHNPLIIKHNDERNAVSYQPNGFALGMEVGGHFPHYIEEANILLKSGDCIILYTDGITEAMNLKKEEFGADRLINLINELSVENPKAVIDKVYANVKSFIGKAPQHDDMTMVVIKIN